MKMKVKYSFLPGNNFSQPTLDATKSYATFKLLFLFIKLGMCQQ